MRFSKQQLWERFQMYSTEFPTLVLSLDLSRVKLDETVFPTMQPLVEKAFAAMTALEGGAIANPGEACRIGHYWLRNPALAPTSEIRREIEETLAEVNRFATEVHSGRIRGTKGPFENYLLIGIGGSALGPQFVANALGDQTTDKLRPYFLDNTDPHGIRRVLSSIGPELGQTICLVASKSGGTKETRNGMLEAKAAYESSGLDFCRHAVAVTRRGSSLDTYAAQNGWLQRFPMWDWVGGPTSVTSAVGLLPASLQGFDVAQLLSGAKACDDITRCHHVASNPAMLLALAWFCAGGGHGKKNTAVPPYHDNLDSLPRYLQQLVMESIGKETDLAGKSVHQGVTALRNKWSIEQHSYIQQVKNDLDNSQQTFIGRPSYQSYNKMLVEESINSLDCLHGFLLGTSQPMTENGTESLSITLTGVSLFCVGMIIALFERAVGFYASLVEINANSQSDVETAKRAASMVFELRNGIVDSLPKNQAKAARADENAPGIKKSTELEHSYPICERLSANPNFRIRKVPATFRLRSPCVRPWKDW